MQTVSISRAWMEAVEFARREAGLLFPVALALVSVPMAILFHFMPDRLPVGAETPETVDMAQMALSPLLSLGAVVTLLLVTIGSLGLYALALRDGISVGEALMLGARRLPALLLAGLMVGVAIIVPLSLIAGAFPNAAAFLTLIASLAIGARLLPLNAMAVDTDLGPVKLLRASWDMTRRSYWRLLGFILLAVALTVFAQTIARMLLGLGGVLLGGPEAGRFGANLGGSLVAGVAQVYISATVARIYRQLVSR